MGRTLRHRLQRYSHCTFSELKVCLKLANRLRADEDRDPLSALSVALDFAKYTIDRNDSMIRCNPEGAELRNLDSMNALKKCLRRRKFRNPDTDAESLLNIGYRLLWLADGFFINPYADEHLVSTLFKEYPSVRWRHLMIAGRYIDDTIPSIPLTPLFYENEMEEISEGDWREKYRPDQFYDFVHHEEEFRQSCWRNILFIQHCFEHIDRHQIAVGQFRKQVKDIHFDWSIDSPL